MTTIYHSPIGILGIKAVDGAITELSFMENASIEENEVATGVMKDCIHQLDEYFSGKRKEFDLPIKANGTEFQQKVWELLNTIPYGKTISYLELSKMFGNVKTIRAIGSANGKNPVAIIIPCHRVIGNDGKMVGYSGKIWRKQWLLEHEGAIVNKQQSLFPMNVG